MWEVLDGNWIPFKEIDGSENYSITNASRDKWGQGYRLSNFYPTYDWTGNNGYENFERWIQ
jgi:hypothetical protein